jgi:alanine racemase
MDMTVVDLTETGAGVGEVATVFGPGGSGEPTVREWADWSGLLEHEVVTGVGARVRRAHKPAAVVLRGLS